MSPTTLVRLARLGRWPRRIAAVACLLYAALSALSARHPGTAAASANPHHTAPRPAKGQLAVPVLLADPHAADYVAAGDRIDLFATPEDPVAASPGKASAVGTRLLVVAVAPPHQGLAGSEQTRVIVAADRDTAARLAGLVTCRVLAVREEYP
jgi:hypothetical protein